MSSYSVSFFVFFGNSRMRNYKNYSGNYSGVSASVWHVTAFHSSSESGFSIGVGWSSSKFSVSICMGRMYLVGRLSNLFSSLFNNVKSRANKAR